MQSRKITQHMAETVAKALVGEAFAEREAAIARRSHTLAVKVYHAKVPKAQRDIMATLPDHYFTPRSCMNVNAGGQYMRMDLADPLLMPAHLCGATPSVTGALADDIQRWGMDKERTKDERKDLYRKVYSAVLQVGTTARLAKTWPEATAHLPASSAPLPAVQIEALRAELANAA